MQTVVGLYDKRTDAQEAYDDLLGRGVGVQHVAIITDQAKDAGMLNELPKHVPEQDARFFMEGARAGGTLVVVDADNPQLASQASGILARHHMVDPAARIADLRKTGEFRADDNVLPEAEEQVQVGKRAVEHGKMRISTHVTERPVEAQVNLRDETIHVERRAVDRPVAPGEDPWRERSYELSKTDEEPVISKTVHIIGEVTLTKEAGEHAEVIHDTVRRTEVEVEELRPDEIRRTEDLRRSSTEP
jgi:uncharacterized protein (TIGR02271 family)